MQLLEMDSEQEYEKTHPEATADAEKPHHLPPKRSTCSSSPWIFSSKEDFFQIDTTELGKQQPVMVLGDRTPSQMGDKDEEIVIHEPAFLAKQSPKFQLMYRSDAPDPNRIPASVFARNKSEMTMEWSVASNESLFSIPMKSEDLSGLCSTNMEACSPLPPGVGIPPSKGLVGSPIAEEVKDAAAIDSIPRSDSTSQHSDAGSVSSSQYSFAFPILTPEERNRSCKGVPEQHWPEQPQQPGKVESVATTSRRSWVSCFCC